jgi:hypothetical protein
MTRGDFWYDVGTWIYVLGLAMGLAFTLLYLALAPWWRTAIGRMFVAIGLALVTAGVTVVIQIMTPNPANWEGRWILRMFGYGSFTLAMGFLLITYLHERRKPYSALPTRKDFNMSDTNTPKPPPIWYPSQRVIRTVLASLVVLVPILNASLPLVAAAFDEPGVPGQVVLVVNGVIAACLVVLGIVTRLMAIPAVNEWLTKIGAGSAPKSAVTSSGKVIPPNSLG